MNRDWTLHLLVGTFCAHCNQAGHSCCSLPLEPGLTSVFRVTCMHVTRGISLHKVRLGHMLLAACAEDLQLNGKCRCIWNLVWMFLGVLRGCDGSGTKCCSELSKLSIKRYKVCNV